MHTPTQTYTMYTYTMYPQTTYTYTMYPHRQHTHRYAQIYLHTYTHNTLTYPCTTHSHTHARHTHIPMHNTQIPEYWTNMAMFKEKISGKCYQSVQMPHIIYRFILRGDETSKKYMTNITSTHLCRTKPIFLPPYTAYRGMLLPVCW